MNTDIWTVLGMLAVVVVILVAAYWCTKLIARRSMTMNTQRVSGKEEMCVLGQINLGRNERIVLVRLHDRCLLLGATDRSVNLLTELSREEAEAWLSKADEAPSNPSFFEALKSNIAKKK